MNEDKVDWLSILPESLLRKVLLNLTTKDVVKCSVLSKRWRNLWRYVPGLNLNAKDFPDLETLVSFVDAFFGFNTESYLESFKLKYYRCDQPEYGLVSRWINIVVDRRVKNLHVWNDSNGPDWIEMPPNLFTCESLVIYHYSRCEQLPLLRSLSFLRVSFVNYKWEMLPIFLESCPNLQSLVVASIKYPEEEGGISSICILLGPPCLLSSLEYVDIERSLKGEAVEMKLLSYFLENSTILKKLTICLDAPMETEEESAILKELFTSSRLSSSCQVIVL